MNEIRTIGTTKPSRGGPGPVRTRVHVGTQPYGTTRPGRGGPAKETGAVNDGAYVEMDQPVSTVPTISGPRKTCVVPTTDPLPIGGLNPAVVPVRRWWNLWYFWR
jgi:hypothetical protein